MAGGTPKRSRIRPPLRPYQPTSEPPLVVEPRWIITAFTGVVLLGLVCAYATLCAVFYYGQWQLVLHPTRDVAQTPAAVNLAFTEVHFADDATGQPQLDGWWLPSQLPSDPTVLLLHDGAGSVDAALPDAEFLHNARLNVLLFDYRGFGHSGGAHPTESSMEEDTRSAFAYLTQTRGISPAAVIAYGRGLGGSLATLLCTEHPAIEALILNAPGGDLETRVAREESRARMVPVGLLFNNQFPLADRLHALHTPKLLLTPSSKSAPLELQRAGDPKMTVEIAPADTAALAESLRRFLDSYVLRVPGELKPG